MPLDAIPFETGKGDRLLKMGSFEAEKRGRESLLIISFASGAYHSHRSGAGSALSRLQDSWQYEHSGVSVGNAIHVSVPCRQASTWVFDDPRVGLS